MATGLPQSGWIWPEMHSFLLQTAAVVAQRRQLASALVMKAWLPTGWATHSSYEVTIKIMPVAILLLLAALCFWACRPSTGRVYLLDFACLKPPESLRVTLPMYMYGCRLHQKEGGVGEYTEESVEFMHRISLKNGLGNSTHLPVCHRLHPHNPTLETARLEPKDIDFLVVNCSLFNPTPSLSAIVVNQLRMRSDIVSYNLSGMGCSAGIISVDLASHLLKASPSKDAYALVLSTEGQTTNWYMGNDRSMLIPNTLFRTGAAAIVLTNKRSERSRAKYELQHCVRVNLAADDAAYSCVYQKEDDDGISGVALNKELVKVAAKALQRNLTLLGPLVLPVLEQLKVAWDIVIRRLAGHKGKAYIPDFRKAFNHFCLHAGGRGVMEGLGGQLRLTKANLEPSFSTLYWYGNTSSSSYWYALSYVEAKQGVRRGDKIWQVGFGSGFKTNSAVWNALRAFKDTSHEAWVHITAEDIQYMWDELEKMGVSFVDGVMPPYEAKAAKKEPNK